MAIIEENAQAVGIPAEEAIEVFGARVHNLKNIDIRIPRNKLVVSNDRSRNRIIAWKNSGSW